MRNLPLILTLAVLLSGCAKPAPPIKPTPGEPLAAAQQQVETIRAHLKVAGHDDKETDDDLTSLSTLVAKGKTAVTDLLLYYEGVPNGLLTQADATITKLESNAALIAWLHVLDFVSCLAVPAAVILAFCSQKELGVICIAAGGAGLATGLFVGEIVSGPALRIIAIVGSIAVSAAILGVVGFGAWRLVLVIKAKLLSSDLMATELRSRRDGVTVQVQHEHLLAPYPAKLAWLYERLATRFGVATA